MQRRKLFCILALLLWTSLGLGASPSLAAENTTEQQVQQQVESVDLSKIQGFIDQLDQDTKDYFPQLNLSNLMSNLKAGKVDFSAQAFFSGIVKLLFKEVVASSGILAKLVVLAVLCGVLQHLQQSFEGSVGKVAQAMSYLVLITIAIASFTLAIDTGRKAIDDMVGFMQALLPVQITLLVALGNITSAAIFHPFVIGALSFISTLIKNFVFPLLFLGAVLAIVNNISEHMKVSKLAGLFNTASKAILGLCLTIFIGIMTIQGVTGSMSDGIALRSAKYATDTFVPVVGRWFSDAIELVVGSALLLKNAVSLVGIIVICIICLIPIIKIVAMMLIYRVAAALVQPLGNHGLSDALQSMGSSLTLVFASVASVGIMFFMAISIIMATGNMTVMLR
ncbi:MAG TPA: stage III sporulation protein AE [Candidatus Deferrimicrobium sp.]|nr:stage III sporulation protein AE [Candidatus Deferrimicrobium sp.]